MKGGGRRTSIAGTVKKPTQGRLCLIERPQGFSDSGMEVARGTIVRLPGNETPQPLESSLPIRLEGVPGQPALYPGRLPIGP